MKRIALVLCAVLALGSGGVAVAQGQNGQAQSAAGKVVGTTGPVDETTLSLGDAGTQARAANNAAGSSTLAYFLRMIVVLALVLAAIYGVYRLMKKASRPQTADSSAVKLLASSSLGQGKALHVVSVGAKAFLIGATDASVNLVSEIDDREFVDGLILQAQTNPPAKPGAGADFGKILAGLLGGARKPGAKKRAGGSGMGGTDFLAGQRDRLRKF